jgi:hypothetical protein
MITAFICRADLEYGQWTLVNPNGLTVPKQKEKKKTFPKIANLIELSYLLAIKINSGEIQDCHLLVTRCGLDW